MRKAALLGAVAACGVALYTVAHAAWYSPSKEQTVGPVADAPAAASPARPERLLIPAIGLDARVQAVGIGQTGNMAVPSNYTDVGWYRYGTLPGALGSAVIDGHADNGFGLNAVFRDIKELKAGDDIYVESAGGARQHFVVEEAAAYAVQDVPREELFNRRDAARLNLITCTGAWEPKQEMYDRRIVVYAVLQN